MIRRLLFVFVLLAGLTAAPAGAAPFPDSVLLPVDFQPEGIAVGTGSTFHVGSLRTATSTGATCAAGRALCGLTRRPAGPRSG
jgi:hypothetical protein